MSPDFLLWLFWRKSFALCIGSLDQDPSIVSFLQLLWCQVCATMHCSFLWDRSCINLFAQAGLEPSFSWLIIPRN
jgi:hypothetical protein